jgi:Flp pilus assembly pilin Flp
MRALIDNSIWRIAAWRQSGSAQTMTEYAVILSVVAVVVVAVYITLGTMIVTMMTAINAAV